jgi:hypothetical protein
VKIVFGAIFDLSCSFTVNDSPSLILQSSLKEPSVSFHLSFLKGNQPNQSHQNKQQTMVFRTLGMNETKRNLNKQLRKAAGLLHRRITPELEKNLDTVRYSIPPLEFSQFNLSVDTTEGFQEEVDSSTASISNSESTLTTVSTNPSSLHLSENGVVDQPFVSQTTTTMQGEGKQALGQKIAAVFQKVKARFWRNKPVEKPCSIEDYTGRCQWDVILQIENATIIEILRLALTKRHEAYRELPMKVVRTARGSYHLVFVVKVRNPVSHIIEGWIVKIPGHGTPDRWTADDEYMLTQEVETMRLITTYTDVPAAVVVDHSHYGTKLCKIHRSPVFLTPRSSVFHIGKGPF